MGETIWPHILNWKNENQLTYTTFFLIIVTFIHNFVHIMANFVYWIFYHFEFTFIERYRSNDKPWPWKEDPEGWRILVRKSIAVFLFNANVLVVGVYLILDKIGLLDEH